MLSEDVRDRRRGFTIVELLIVVVIIAILAAITIVAYNGITNRAKATAASSAAEQAAKKVMTYAVTNAETYPASLSDAGVSDGSATYQYRVDNTANPRTFCVTATTQNVSYYVSSTTVAPTSGVCAGHAASGQTLVTNWVTNPAATGTSLLVVSTGAPNISISNDSMSGWPRSAPSSYKIVATTSAETRVRPPNNTIPLDTAQPVQASFYVYNAASVARNFLVSFQGRTAAGVPLAYVPSSTVTIPAQSSSRVTGVLTTSDYSAFAGAAYIEPMIGRTSGATGDVFYVDDVFASYGATVRSYGDGSTPGWVWDGTPHNSTSTGPAL